MTITLPEYDSVASRSPLMIVHKRKRPAMMGGSQSSIDPLGALAMKPMAIRRTMYGMRPKSGPAPRTRNQWQFG